jgi:hypothetical protein
MHDTHRRSCDHVISNNGPPDGPNSGWNSNCGYAISQLASKEEEKHDCLLIGLGAGDIVTQYIEDIAYGYDPGSDIIPEPPSDVVAGPRPRYPAR